MLKFLCLLFAVSHAGVSNKKIITRIRHGIESNLDYIGKNSNRVTVDCLFGVVLATVFLMDVYENGTHPMDVSTMTILDKAVNIVEDSSNYIEEQYQWKKRWIDCIEVEGNCVDEYPMVKYILDYKIWYKDIQYKANRLDPDSYIVNYETLQKIYEYQDFSSYNPDSDSCLQAVAFSTTNLVPKKCHVPSHCLQNPDSYATGYTLTHKLLFLQLAKARQCLLDEVKYLEQTNKLCSLIFSEVFNMDFFDEVGTMFDLFLEELVLCGYEGYSEFFNFKWLWYVLKTQQKTGCYQTAWSDNITTRWKKNWKTFEDGCTDHTTGLGLAVLALHYNYILKQNIADFDIY